ncbi:MAG: Crp/Fnr family transcriptional regulator [Nannocystaceae bacterium]|nr:Crp/Fnr family transcriptional regulator [Nannocystaceae bacterium]
MNPALQVAVDRVEAFAALPSADAALLLAEVRTRQYEHDEVVVECGDKAESFFGVSEGHLKVVMPGVDGRQITMGIYGRGEAFGAPALLLDEPRAARVVALERSVLVVLSRAGFDRLLLRSPTFSRRILNMLATRMRHIAEHHEDVVSLALRERIAKKLVLLARHFGEQRGDHVGLVLALSQQELADLVGTTRQSINKHLRAWVTAGYLRLEDNRLVVLDQAGLLRPL